VRVGSAAETWAAGPFGNERGGLLGPVEARCATRIVRKVGEAVAIVVAVVVADELAFGLARKGEGELGGGKRHTVRADDLDTMCGRDAGRT
jgi:hypothetical protein